MLMRTKVLNSSVRLSIGLLPVLMIACGGGYQAPVTEQSERQIVRAPLIVDSSSPSGALNAPRNSVVVISSSPSTSSSSRPALVSSTSVANSRSHTVRAGDTLFSIAFQYDLDFRSVAIANDLNPPYTIFVGNDINLDMERVGRNQSSIGSNIGTPVDNNSVARTQGSVSRTGGLIRQTIGGSGGTPNWEWPHTGRVLRGFQTDSNKGIDISGQIGDPVLAASSGDVVYSGRGVQGSGNLIIIRHSDRYLSAYAHNSAVLVGEGSHVQAGEKIAEVGNSPNGVAMLHFEIRVDGASVDPTGFLPRR
ncbi:MAG: peptidoglycan DD-metalloendopeptidase family protein [Proteobacteria bacterium]|nr:peptidoglycan DD-metalloendopeptidase family protein [Pseudomonadota bacterium]